MKSIPHTLEITKKVKGDLHSRPYYDANILQKRYNILSREKDLKSNFFSFLSDSALLTYFFIKDKRFRKIFNVFFKLLRKVRNRKNDIPLYIKESLIELGSTFIKIGQFLSTRTDLLSKEYTDALSELQDSLPPIPYEEIKLQIEKELRKPQDQIFKYFNPVPIASASIGQVHRGELLNGSQVVVKIQRPNLNLLFYEDLAILRCLASYLTKHTKPGKDREWIQIVDEIGKTLFEEIDFIQEGRNADRFRKNLRLEENIYIPKVFWKYTTRKLITIEFVPGIKITDIEELKKKHLNSKELAQTLVNAYFKQFFEDGFYHADPHPGNIVVKDNGTIVFYDFGMVGRINENIRRELLNVLVCIVGNDTDTLLNTLKNLDLIKNEVDISPLKRVINQAVYRYYEGVNLDSLELIDIQEDLKQLFKEKPMKLPSKFTYTLRMTGTLEGVCKTLDPDFSLINVAKPYLQNWLTSRVPESKWVYIKSLFPSQTKLVKKMKVYVGVLKDLPKYVSEYETKTENQNGKSDKEISNIDELQEKYLSKTVILKDEIKLTNLKLKLSYVVLFLLCMVLVGNLLTQTNNLTTSYLGFLLLCFSFLISIGIVWWSINLPKKNL